jgi:hypothetical protein
MRLNGISSHHLQRSKRATRFLTLALIATFVGTTPAALKAQQLIATSSSSSTPAVDPALTTLPDAPSTTLQQQQQPGQTTTTTPAPIDTTNPDAVSPNGHQQTKRVLGIVPNFTSVSADIKLPPMSPKQKLGLAAKSSFDYSSFLVAGIEAGISMNSKSYPEFSQGLEGYGKYYWHTLADTADENFMVGGLGPILFHQDPRFYTLGHGGFRKRSWYAVTRVLVTRTDSGKSNFNFSEVIGSGAAAGLSTVYYPQKYQTWTKVGQKWLTSDLIDCFNFWWKEWWPTVNSKVFHQK